MYRSFHELGLNPDGIPKQKQGGAPVMAQLYEPMIPSPQPDLQSSTSTKKRNPSVMDRLKSFFSGSAASQPQMHHGLASTSLFAAQHVQVGGGGAAHSLRLTCTKNMGNVAHVFCVIQLPGGSFLLVQGKSFFWGFPGGNVDKGETSWNAAKREFSEEVNSQLPILRGQSLGSTTSKPVKFHWAHQSSITGFYCGCPVVPLNEFSRNFRVTNEIINIRAFTVHELWQMVRSTHPTNMRLRRCAIESTCALLIALGFPERS